MKTKLTFIPLAIIFLSIFAAVVSAASVTTSLFYDETTGNSLTITDGDYFGLIISADSIFENSMTIRVDLKNADTGRLVNNLVRVETTQDSYFRGITIGPQSYGSEGNYVIVSTVTGASGQTATDELYLTVNPQPVINNRPEITSNPLTQINEGASYSYDVDATDADGDTLTYSLTQNPEWLTINSETGLITGTAPLLDNDYNYAVTVEVSDGKDTAIQYYTLTVNNVANTNNPPVITSSPITSVNENAEYNYQVTATDADGDLLIYALVGPSWLTINPITGLVSGTAPEVDADTEYPISVVVSDVQNVTMQIYMLTVINVPTPGNNAPVLSAIPDQNVNENSQYSYQTTATDADGDSLTYTITGPNWLSISSTGLITGTAPTVDSDTPFSVTVTVSDGTDSDTETYTLTVKNLVSQNNPPVINSIPNQEIDERDSYSYQVTATDADGDTLTYTITGPNWLTISNTGLITGTAPGVSSDTDFTITVTVSDGQASASRTYTLTVKDTGSSNGGRATSGGSGTRIIPASDFEMQKYFEQFKPGIPSEEEQQETETQSGKIKVLLVIFWILVLLLLLLLAIMLLNRLRR